MRARLLGLLLIFALPLASCAERREQLKERAKLHLEMGSAHLAQGNYPAALSELLAAEQLDPDNPLIQNNLGLAYSVRGRFREAMKHLNKALKLKPSYSDARTNVARLEIDEKNYDEALKNLSIVENDLTYPYPEKPLSLKGMVYFYKGKYKKAEEYLARSMNAKRESCITSDFYGRTLFEEKKLDEAAGILDLAIENCRPTGFEEPLFYSAMTYYSLGDREKSKARLEELIKQYPQSQYYNKAKGLMSLLD